MSYMARPVVLFVYAHEHPGLWRDGLWAALELLKDEFLIEKLNLHGVRRMNRAEVPRADVYLGWGAFGSAQDQMVRSLSGKKGLLIAGNLVPPLRTGDYDVLFYETKWYKPQLRGHPNIVHAFGVNTDIYSKPKEKQELVWDYIGVGAYAKWKRWERMAEKEGRKLVIGQYQRSNEVESREVMAALVKGGVMVADQVHPQELVKLLWRSKRAYIPAMLVGGGERSVLEARACGLEVEVENDNPKLGELLNSEIYDHKYYAGRLRRGIELII